MFAIVYFYQGERYRHSGQWETREEAREVLFELRSEGWSAWIEQV